jgi:hypothetical protein
VGDIGVPLSGFITVVVKYGSTLEIPRLQAKNASELTAQVCLKFGCVNGRFIVRE